MQQKSTISLSFLQIGYASGTIRSGKSGAEAALTFLPDSCGETPTNSDFYR